MKKSWSTIRNEKIRKAIEQMRNEGERPREIYRILAEKYGISQSRIRQIEYGIQAA